MVVASFNNEESNCMKVAMIGTGYVGLVTGACLAEVGHHVTCVDTDTDKIQRLQKGRISIYEPGLETLVLRNQQIEQLAFTTNLAEAVHQADVVFIAVGTPNHEDGSADVGHVIKAATSIGEAIAGYTVIINKSTVPVGTVAHIRHAVGAATTQPFSVVSNPEFLKQGDAIKDFMCPERIVVGVDDERATTYMRQLYAPIIPRSLDGIRYLTMDSASAELCKYASNAMLATRISFMNEMAHVCDCVGANIDHVRRAMGADSRIGPEFLHPGPGYGGSCFPKDVAALVSFAGKKNYDFKILKAVEQVNTRQKDFLFEQIFKHFGGSIRGRTIAIWGLAFKPNTDDMREAPSIRLIKRLLFAGAHVRVYDPQAMGSAKLLLGPDVVYVGTRYGALSGADALALVTEWDEFRDVDVPRMKAAMKTPTLFDGRNLYNAEDMRDQGMTYYSIGRQ